MFADFLRRLTEPGPAPLPDLDARLALAALLVRIARTDGDYSASEVSRIDRVLGARYGLTESGAAALRADAEGVEEQAPDTVRFTRAIKDAVPLDHRTEIVESLWEIVLADGQRDYEEDALMRLVAPMLGLNDRDSNLARKRVEDRRG